ncbi:metallophosphoesterase [Candidatus Peregrinibacteria bacterium]|nr:metallophosphoesterase [Candidatus Peregrinibacteria bacterium]
MANPSIKVPEPENPVELEKEQRALLFSRGVVDALLKRGSAMIDTEADHDPFRMNSSGREYNEVFRETDVYSVPDIHGDIQALRQSLDAMGLIDAQGNWIGGNSVVQFLGDYIDRGDTSLEVLDYLIKLKRQIEAAGGRMDLLIGNHEFMLLGAILGDKSRREFYSNSRNGGDVLLEEVRRKYNVPDDNEVLWKKMKELFVSGGKYAALFDSMKLMSQVDDVLYVHGGINGKWAKLLEREGVDGMNQSWQDAYEDLKDGNDEAYKELDYDYSPLWIRYNQDMRVMNDQALASIAASLKKRGINAIVLGHDYMESGPQLHHEFLRFGIKVVATDVAMSKGYSLKSYSYKGGVKIDQEGNIEAQSRRGGARKLYDAESDKAAAASLKAG